MSHITKLRALLDGSGAISSAQLIKKYAFEKFKNAVTVTTQDIDRFHLYVIVTQDGTIPEQEFLNWFRGIASHMEIVS